MNDPRVEQSLTQRTLPPRVTPPYAQAARGLPEAGGSLAGGGGVFPVMLTKYDGNPGGAAQECSYRYTVKDITETDTLATAVTPETPRLHYCAYWYAGETRDAPAVATSRRGLAYYDEDGTLILSRADGEIGKNNVC